VTGSASLGATYGAAALPNEYIALLPNYASYENPVPSLKPGSAVVFDWQSKFDVAPIALPAHPAGAEWFNPASLPGAIVGNKVRANSTVDIGGMDESWDAPDFQNMFLAMVPPRAAEAYAAGILAADF